MSGGIPVANLHSKMLGARPPSGPKFGKIVCWRHPMGWRPHLGEILDPPLDHTHPNSTET